MRKIILLGWLLCWCGIAFAQQAVRGKVTSQADGSALPGVSIRVKGNATAGTVTDLDGNFELGLPVGNETLVASFTGFVTQEIQVNNRTQINISLAQNTEVLDEVVVIGYGVQQKKLVTGATAQVKGEDIQKQSTTNALQALQGQAPGVQISSTSGQPGEGMRVLIRGLGTIGNSGPLYVVDGVLTTNIDFLNPADIASIDVLKDAASAAIYGSQAANGVVLITTRQGTAGQPARITFDSYYGVQNVARKADLLNSREYATIMNEAAVNSGKLPYFTNQQIAEMGEGTNWMDEMFVKNALTQNYSLGAQGGSENSTYSTALSYTSQEGIVGGKALSNYERYNFRINSEHKLYKDVIKIGQHLNFAYINNNGIGVGNQYNNSLRGAFNTSPFVPMYDEEGNFYDNSNSTWNTGEANPYATMVYGNQNRRNNQRLLGDAYMVIEPIKNLRFRTSLGLDMHANESHSYTPIYRLSAYSFSDFTRVNQSMGKGRTILFDNLLSYNFNATPDHSFELMVGSSAFQNLTTNIWGSNRDLIISDLRYAWLSNATSTDGAPNMSVGGGPDPEDKRMSYFGRLNYNYKERYLLNATFRADGSSRFARGHRWGYFPSVSAGWIVSDEVFMTGTQNWVDYLKIRASWGQVGNQNIDFFQYLSPVAFTNANYIFGPEEGVLSPGAFPSRLGNERVKWETSEQTDIGFDARFFKGKVDVSFDWYNKITKDWLVNAPILATAGALAPFINGGNVRNRGVELGITYNNAIGDFNYRVGVNGAYNTNKVGVIPTADGIIHGNTNTLFDNATEFYRAENGFPIGYFWGYKTDGIFQSEDEVSSYRSGENRMIQPNAQPGDVRYVDLNGDGVINEQDKTMIGNPNPKYTFGLTLSADYKGFDFSMLASGVAGNQIVQSYRNQANPYANHTSSVLGRWHGPGSSTTMPRVTEDSRNWTNFSDLYLQDGDFLRISNVTIGYDFGRILKKSYLSQVRIYASALNLYTFTKYNGMDPEIGYTESFAQGVDVGYYPRPRTFMMGANFRF
ncbi:TonB-dependent receptor [Pontibacter sp. 13R65]|uniref:SusC/RagA family TonB-linked outer membrane protein n=1 Tax=Pontibacter sp. 13R65 TaxID=3127458 RepID=UPI00301E1968